MKRLICLFTIIALISVSFAVAQPKHGEFAVANVGEPYGNALIGLGLYGNVTTVLPLPTPPDGLCCHDLGGPDLIVSGKIVYDYKNGVLRTITRSLEMPAHDVMVHEDASWLFPSGNAVFGLNRHTSTRSTFATGFVGATSTALDPIDGCVMVVDSADDKLYRMAGSAFIGGISVKDPRCMCWDPYTGEMFLACIGNLARIDASGNLTVLSVGTPGLDNPVGIFLRYDRKLFIAQGGSDGGIFAYDGTTGAFIRKWTTEPITPVGMTIEHSRDLWPAGPAKMGTTLVIRVNGYASHRGKAFFGALSFGHMPGIPLGYYTLHLAPDALFFASLNTPAIFEGNGTLDVNGNGKMRVHIPFYDPLVGMRIYAGAVVPDPARYQGIGWVSYPMGFTIQQ